MFVKIKKKWNQVNAVYICDMQEKLSVLALYGSVETNKDFLKFQQILSCKNTGFGYSKEALSI